MFPQGRDRGSPPARQREAQNQRNSTPSRRDHVRVTNIPRQNATNRRNTKTIRTERTFTRTSQGRRYENGTQLRPAVRANQSWQRPYFPRGNSYYPYYEPRYSASLTYISPFGFYFGIAAPFLSRQRVYDRRPRNVYVELVSYRGDNFQRYDDTRSENYFDRRDLGRSEPGLNNAIDELREAFGRGNIDSLATLVDPQTEIAIFERGAYSYSMDANDYLDVARDAIASTRTIRFDLTMLHRRANGVYAVSGRHDYRDRNGRSRTVYVSYVLESIDDRWTLTQVGAAPDRIQEWR